MSSSLMAIALLLGTCATARADESLARDVPAEAGFFVEIRDGAELLLPLLDPQIWTTLAELAGQPSRPEDAAEWRQQIRQTIGMEPAEAIKLLLSQRVAFVGAGLGRSQDAVALCRPAGIAIGDLLKRWKATRLDGRELQFVQPPTYHLHGMIGVATRDDTLWFGALLPADSVFRRFVPRSVDPATPRLADDPVYQLLLRRVPENPQGVLFARLMPRTVGVPRPVPISQPAGAVERAVAPANSAAAAPTSTSAPTSRAQRAVLDLPGPLRDASNLMFALHRDGKLLHFTAVGDRAGEATRTPLERRLLARELPARTLLAWEGRVDFSRLAEAIAALPERNAIRLALQSVNHGETARAIAAALEGELCVAIGTVEPQGRVADAPAAPAIAILARVRSGDELRDELAAVVQALTAAYNAVSMLRGIPPLAVDSDVRLGDVKAEKLDFSPFLDTVDGGAIHELHLAWAIDRDVLLIATHVDWLKQLLDARLGAAETLAQTIDLTKRDPATVGDNLVAIQLGPISDLGERWLSFLGKNQPQILDESYWRLRQPGGGGVRLGIDVSHDPEQPTRLRVNSVTDGQAASGRLQVGDRIIGASGKNFATSQPSAEIRDALINRPQGQWIELIVDRGGKKRTERIPLPYVDPIRTLRRAIAIGKVAKRVVYQDDLPDAAGPRGFLTIELRSAPTGSAPTASAPASAPSP